ncbi:MAG: M23 family metallopeptidase [candidate division Zixibacteria bacterium]
MNRTRLSSIPMPMLAFLLVSFLLIFAASAQTDNVDDTPCCCQGLAGNVNNDSLDNVNILDLTFVVDLIFRGGEQPLCPREGDVNGDGNEDTNILDLTALVDFIFRGGSGPSDCIQPVHPVHQLGEDGEIICDVDFGPPCISLYILPFQVGNTFGILGSNCAPVGGHVNWFAYDFDTQMGDTIIASRAGTVIVSNDQYSDDDFTCGHENNVFILHSDGTVIRYTHLLNSGNLVEVGETVVQGQPLGLSGRSGCTGGVPHLHFAAFHNRFNYDRQNSICINFSNAYGWHDSNNGLVSGQLYRAEPY